MIIANPIYDVVFKYLLDDADIARELLGTILGVDIVELNVKPQETLIKGETGEIRIFHLDFKAVINLESGAQKTVLIELQKAKKSHDILRFRKYLGENYAKEEVRTNARGQSEGYAIEIVAIYILGYNLVGVEVPVLKVSRTFIDAITQEVVTADNPFIYKLTHESYTIQILRLRHDQRNKLEEVLEVFSQDNISDSLYKIEYSRQPKNPLAKKILRRLSKAAANDEMRRQMEAEEMIDRLINRESEEKLNKQAEEYEGKLMQKEEELMQKEEELMQNKEELIQNKEELIQNKEELMQKEEELMQNKEDLKQNKEELMQKDREIEKLRILLGKK